MSNESLISFIQSNNIDGIKRLGLDREVINGVLVGPTPFPEEFVRIQFRRPTPLVYAILWSRSDVVRLLISLGADVHRPVYGWRPIHYAALLEDSSCLKILLTADPHEVNAVTEPHHATALHITISNGRVESSRWLLRRGSDVNLANANGETALHMFVAKGIPALELLEDLVSHKPNMQAKNSRGQTPKDLAKSGEMLELLQNIELIPTSLSIEEERANSRRSDVMGTIDLDDSTPGRDFGEELNERSGGVYLLTEEDWERVVSCNVCSDIKYRTNIELQVQKSRSNAGDNVIENLQRQIDRAVQRYDECGMKAEEDEEKYYSDISAMIERLKEELPTIVDESRKKEIETEIAVMEAEID